MPLSKINKFYFFTSEHGNVCKANELTIIIIIIIITITITITTMLCFCLVYLCYVIDQ